MKSAFSIATLCAASSAVLIQSEPAPKLASDSLRVSEYSSMCYEYEGECSAGDLYIETDMCGEIFSASLDNVSYVELGDGSVEITDLWTEAVIKLTPIEYDPDSRVNECGKYWEMKDVPNFESENLYGETMEE